MIRKVPTRVEEPGGRMVVFSDEDRDMIGKVETRVEEPRGR